MFKYKKKKKIINYLNGKNWHFFYKKKKWNYKQNQDDFFEKKKEKWLNIAVKYTALEKKKRIENREKEEEMVDAVRSVSLDISIYERTH